MVELYTVFGVCTDLSADNEPLLISCGPNRGGSVFFCRLAPIHW